METRQLLLSLTARGVGPGCTKLCYTIRNEDWIPEDGRLLSHVYVRRRHVFWHEEIAQLKS